MSQYLLLHGWNMVKLSEVYEFTKKPRGLKYLDFERIPFVPMDFVPADGLYIKNFVLKSADELSSGTYFEPGDILIAKITPSFENGKQGIIEDLPYPFGIATTEVIPVRGIPDVSNKLFLFYYLLRQDIRSELASKMDGSTGRQRLSKSALENLDLPLPPLQEQRAIAHVLRTTQEAKEARLKELALERERKAALMEHLFTHGTRGEPTKQTELGELPESWKIIELNEACEFLQYGTSKQCDEDTSGIPVLRIPNIINGKVNIHELKFIKLPEDSYKLIIESIIY